MSKVVLITGGSSGIGKSIGEFLIQKDFIVYGTSRSPEKYSQSKFTLLKLDVSNQASINETVSTIIKDTGKIDILINNAGVGITGPIEEIPEKEIKQHFDTNFFGPIAIIKSVLPQMRNQKSGLIINITSIAGYMGLPYRGIYSASKAALKILTEAYRMELKNFNIKMTTVAPGDFATNIASRRYHAPVILNSPYETSYKNTLNTIDEHVNDGQDPQLIAYKVFKIINSNYPKIHYKVGKPLQLASILLKRLLPDTWFEKLLLRHYKL